MKAVKTQKAASAGDPEKVGNVIITFTRKVEGQLKCFIIFQLQLHFVIIQS
jgi:hypothetical protein